MKKESRSGKRMVSDPGRSDMSVSNGLGYLQWGPMLLRNRVLFKGCFRITINIKKNDLLLKPHFSSHPFLILYGC